VARSLALCAVLMLFAACTAGATASERSGPPAVVAAEDFWGSIARQLGGSQVAVRSLITSPDADPHDYEPTPSDARALAAAQVVITNGIGYDPWIDKLLAANRSHRRVVVKVGDLVGLHEGANPHQWYSPAVVGKVIGAVVAAYQRVDPARSADYQRQRADFETNELGAYTSAIADIKAKYAGTPVGASESIVAPLARALGLNLVTPAPFLDAISEGNDPTAADTATVNTQIATRAIKVFVYNRQNATPDVQRLVHAAEAHGIPVTTVTETLTPKGATFQDWQVRQLRALEAALAAATGR